MTKSVAVLQIKNSAVVVCPATQTFTLTFEIFSCHFVSEHIGVAMFLQTHSKSGVATNHKLSALDRIVQTPINSCILLAKFTLTKDQLTNVAHLCPSLSLNGITFPLLSIPVFDTLVNAGLYLQKCLPRKQTIDVPTYVPLVQNIQLVHLYEALTAPSFAVHLPNTPLSYIQLYETHLPNESLSSRIELLGLLNLAIPNNIFDQYSTLVHLSFSAVYEKEIKQVLSDFATELTFKSAALPTTPILQNPRKTLEKQPFRFIISLSAVC